MSTARRSPRLVCAVTIAGLGLLSLVGGVGAAANAGDTGAAGASIAQTHV